MSDRKRILSEPDKGLSQSKDVLTRFFRGILDDGNVGPGLWSNLMGKYLRDPMNGIRQDTKTISSESGNLCKALLNADTMTWRTFTKGIRLLSYLTVYVRLELHYKLFGKPAVVSKITLVNKQKEIDFTKEVSDNAEPDVQDFEDEISRLKARVLELETELAERDKKATNTPKLWG